MDIAGRASAVRQALIANVIDDFTLDIAPAGASASSTRLSPSASNPPRRTAPSEATPAKWELSSQNPWVL